MSSLENPSLGKAAFNLPSAIGRVWVRSEGNTSRPEPVSGWIAQDRNGLSGERHDVRLAHLHALGKGAGY
jgi:hypothetical protein